MAHLSRATTMYMRATTSQISVMARPALLGSRTSAFGGQRMLQQQTVINRQSGRVRSTAVRVVSFKFMKQLGLKKPDFLPDFGKDKRQALLDKFFTSKDKAVWDEILADDFVMTEGDNPPSTFSKKDYMGLVFDVVLPSIPDFNWGHATDASKDADGYCIVTVECTGHHTGAPFSLGEKYPPVKATGKRFNLATEVIKVKVEDQKIQSMTVLPVKGAGPVYLYNFLAGKA